MDSEVRWRMEREMTPCSARMGSLKLCRAVEGESHDYLVATAHG